MKIPYDASVAPPAPFLSVRVSNLGDALQSADIPALIDTGSDITVIPERLIDELRLARSGDFPVQGYDGQTVVVNYYDVILRVAEMRLVGLPVVPFADDHVLLGRDALNYLRLLLDGPALVLEVLAPPQSHAS